MSVLSFISPKTRAGFVDDNDAGDMENNILFRTMVAALSRLSPEQLRAQRAVVRRILSTLHALLLTMCALLAYQTGHPTVAALLAAVTCAVPLAHAKLPTIVRRRRLLLARVTRARRSVLQLFTN